MSTPTNIPDTPMGEIEQYFFFESQGEIETATSGHLPDNPEVDWADQLDQLCHWMEYKQYLTVDEFYESS